MIVIISQFLLVFIYSVASSAPDTLRLVNVLYRHGDRSPVNVYPKDPYGEKIWPQGLGWLTEVGMRQQYALGQFLRSEYGDFLNSTYKNTEIVVESSDKNRCLMSSYCNLAGLYPPVDSQRWNEKLLWQPIPVHTRPITEDNKLAMEKACVRYDELYAQELRGPKVQQEEKTNAAFYQLLDKVTGVKRENISVMWAVADTLIVEKAHNLTLPNWTREAWKNGTVFSKLMELKDWSFALLFNGTWLSRLKGGPLLKEMIENMQNAASDSRGTQYKMHMYSAHDTTVSALLSAMRVFNHRAPPYATAVFVELHAVNGGHCVKIRFRNSTQVPPYSLQHPQCQEECCPLDRFVEVTKDRVPLDWETECHNSQERPDRYWEPLMSGTVLALVTMVGILIIFFAILSISYLRQRRIVKNFELI
ncbi:prostatic acid phosphatase-like [Babylonia areolata]|uniref:prostatic acid phosphatase-like n=1 Tax=Babylonia areolata TaxID=304850 RepID=UPI003FD1D72D